LRPITLEIKISLNRADAPQVFEAPDYAACSKMDAAITILPTVEGVRRPKQIMAEIIERIGRDFGDRLFRCIRISGQTAQWDMVGMFHHGALLSRRSAADPGQQQAFSTTFRPTAKATLVMSPGTIAFDGRRKVLDDTDGRPSGTHTPEADPCH
jgi:non-ribosomal peptide synthetase component F